MKTIKLTKGYVSLVDDEDFERVNKFKWYFDHKYARHKSAQESFYLHQLVMNFPTLRVDHINGDALDNRKENLRLCSQMQNSHNTKSHSDSFYSKYKGVSYNKSLKLWTASICTGGKKFTKYRRNEIEAALAYNEMAKTFHQEFARLNTL